MRVQVVSLVLVLLLSLVSIAAVTAIEVRNTAEASIYPNETAVYTFTVKNADTRSERIELAFGLDPKWSFETDPLSYLSGFTVEADETITFDLHIVPTSPYISSGKYAITIPIQSDTGEEEFVDLILYIKNPDALTGYLPSLNFLLDAQEQVDPRQLYRVKLEIQNRNPLDIDVMKVQLTSALYNETQTTSIDPLGSSTVLFEINYGAQQPPTEDTLLLTVTVGTKIFNPIKKEIEIIPYADIVEVQYSTKSFLFKTTQTTEYTNKGNSDVTKTFRYGTSGFEQYFTGGSPEGAIVEEEGLLYYETDVLLAVNVPVTVTYTVSYRSILYYILLFILAGICYYFLRSPLVVNKEVVTISVDKEGHTKMKVLIHIKNRTMHLVDDVEVIDKIPAVAEIEKHFELGTMKPEKVMKHDKAGTVLFWKIPHLEAYEERIITYKVSSIYQIVGDFKLPAVLVKFKNKKQQHGKVSSNTVRVGKNVEDQ
ncbi:MAG: hypothetical protein AABX98_04125 [Nanoarchaeota archaeon]